MMSMLINVCYDFTDEAGGEPETWKSVELDVEFNGYHVQIKDHRTGKVIYTRGTAYGENMDGWYDETHALLTKGMSNMEKALEMIARMSDVK